MLDAKIIERLKNSDGFIRWAYPAIEALNVPADDRTRIAGSVLDVALDHHRAIVVLIGAEIPSTAFAIMRLLFDTYCRGVWLHQCASDEEVKDYVADKHDVKFQDLLDRIEKLPAFNQGLLSDMKKRSWKAMNSYTHAGLHQIVRRNTAEAIEPAFEIAEIVEVLDAADALAIMAAMEIAGMAKADDLQKALLDRMKAL